MFVAPWFLLLAGFCHLSLAAPPQKIVGGIAAQNADYPWVVSLRYYGSHMCGGVFIGPRHVLTAAHCVQHGDSSTGSPDLVDPANLSVAAGSSSRRYYGHLYKVTSFDVYPAYEGKAPDYLHDIAVLTLDRDVVEDKTQRIINLPDKDTPGNQLGYVVGWGRVEEDAPLADVMLKAPMWTLSNPECYEALPYPIYGPQLCAHSSPGHGFCDGDSGGPLIVDDTVVGVVSTSYGCGRGWPDIYTRVYSYAKWIKKIIR